MSPIENGSPVFLVHRKKSFLVKVSDRDFHTHFGVVNLAELIGAEYGTRVTSHAGHTFVIKVAEWLVEKKIILLCNLISSFFTCGKAWQNGFN